MDLATACEWHIQSIWDVCIWECGKPVMATTDWLWSGLLQNNITRFSLVKFAFLLSSDGDCGCKWAAGMKIGLLNPSHLTSGFTCSGFGQHMGIFLPCYGSWEIFEQTLLRINPACMFTRHFSLKALGDCHLRCWDQQRCWCHISHCRGGIWSS